MDARCALELHVGPGADWYLSSIPPRRTYRGCREKDHLRMLSRQKSSGNAEEHGGASHCFFRSNDNARSRGLKKRKPLEAHWSTGLQVVGGRARERIGRQDELALGPAFLDSLHRSSKHTTFKHQLLTNGAHMSRRASGHLTHGCSPAFRDGASNSRPTELRSGSYRVRF
jgi:hypothetical protein